MPVEPEQFLHPHREDRAASRPRSRSECASRSGPRHGSAPRRRAGRCSSHGSRAASACVERVRRRCRRGSSRPTRSGASQSSTVAGSAASDRSGQGSPSAPAEEARARMAQAARRPRQGQAVEAPVRDRRGERVAQRRASGTVIGAPPDDRPPRRRRAAAHRRARSKATVVPSSMRPGEQASIVSGRGRGQDAGVARRPARSATTRKRLARQGRARVERAAAAVGEHELAARPPRAGRRGRDRRAPAAGRLRGRTPPAAGRLACRAGAPACAPNAPRQPRACRARWPRSRREASAAGRRGRRRRRRGRARPAPPRGRRPEVPRRSRPRSTTMRARRGGRGRRAQAPAVGGEMALRVDRVERRAAWCAPPSSGRRRRRIEEGEGARIANAPGGAIEQEAGEIGGQDLGPVEGVERARRGLRPEPVADARLGAPGAAAALVGRGARDAHASRAGSGRSPARRRGTRDEPGIDHDAHALDGQRGLGDRGGEHDLAPARRGGRDRRGPARPASSAP